MPSRRYHSLKHGSASDKPVVWHREHRSKKGRQGPRIMWGHIKRWKQRREELKIEDLKEQEKNANC